ncbi:hypothetical protein VPH35_006527 [Triticum aestivum]
MSRLRLLRRSSSSTTLIPLLRLLRRCSTSTSTSPPSRSWSPRDAFVAAIERVRAGTLSPEDAHHLFDDLLGQATPVPYGPALAVALFTRVCQEEAGPRVATPTVHTYGILMDCCCRARRPDLGLALFGRFLGTGLRTNEIVATTFLKCLCCAKRTEEVVKVLLHRMPELGCVPNAISYSIVLKSLCENSMSQQALDLLQMVGKEGGCLRDVVAYNTIIHGFFKEGGIDKACHLFHEMMRQGVVPTVVTYNTVIDALCKAGEMDKAELVFQQMARNGAQPNKVTCNGSKFSSLTDGYCSVGKMDKTFKLLDAMVSVGIEPDAVTYSALLDGYFKNGRIDDGLTLFREMSFREEKKLKIYELMPESPVLYAVSSTGGACYIQVKVWPRIHRCVLSDSICWMPTPPRPCIDALHLLPLFRYALTASSTSSSSTIPILLQAPPLLWISVFFYLVLSENSWRRTVLMFLPNLG